MAQRRQARSQTKSPSKLEELQSQEFHKRSETTDYIPSVSLGDNVIEFTNVLRAMAPLLIDNLSFSMPQIAIVCVRW